LTLNEKTKGLWLTDSLTDSKNSSNLIYSWFHHECQSDLCRPKVFEFCHIPKRFITYPNILFYMTIK
jgi:hypothetical protein